LLRYNAAAAMRDADIVVAAQLVEAQKRRFNVGWPAERRNWNHNAP
jgi:hypothetical protein